MIKILVFCFLSLLMSVTLNAGEINMENKVMDTKTHLVIALPYRENMPLDPINWYTEEYVTYIAGMLPKDEYIVTGYFVSLQNIPKFLNDMKTLYVKKKNVIVLNICDGGEWDGYPGISVTKAWEAHEVNLLIPFSGADSKFIFNSDDKARMQSFIAQAGLKALPQILIPSTKVSQTELSALLARECLNQEWPLFCKLNIGAGALGVTTSSVCNNIEELMAQLKKMHEKYPISDLIVQPYLKGPEYTILVLKDRVYCAVRRDFNNPYNLMEDNYLHDSSSVSSEITFYEAPLQAQELALKSIQAIPGKHHYTRIDMREDGKGNTYVIDINDRPALGNPSTVKCMLEFNKLSEPQLIRDIIKSCSSNSM